MNENKETGKPRTGKRWFVRTLAVIIGVWTVSVIAFEILLSTPLVTNTVNRIAARYIDGEISFGRVSASMLKNFPSLTLELEDFSVTYPSDRFDADEKKGPQGMLMYMGGGQTADTLASFSRFTTSVRVTPLLFGNLIIPQVADE